MTGYNDRALRLGRDSVGKLLLEYSIPGIISMLAVSLYNIVDRIFIGHGVGPLAISGLTLTFPIMNLFAAIGTLTGVGSSARISIALGQKDMKLARNILGNAILLTLTLSLCLVIPSLFFMEEILRLFEGSDKTIPYAMEYLQIVIPGSVFINITYSYSGIMRASGYPGKSMMAIILGVVVNAILDPIFIFWLDMGIRGAAIATVISMFVSAMFVMSHFLDRRSTVHFERGSMKIRPAILWSIISIGLSPFLMNSATCLVNILINKSLVQQGGDLAVGAYGIISSYGILFVMCVMGLCMGMQPIMGYNFGYRRTKRMKDTLKLTLISGIIITSAGFLITELFPSQLVRAFTSDEELIAIASRGMRFTFAVFPLVGFQIVTANFFQSIGRAGQSIFMTLTRQLIFLIPFIYIFGEVWGLTGVWLAMPAADFISFIVALISLNYAKRLFYTRDSEEHKRHLIPRRKKI